MHTEQRTECVREIIDAHSWQATYLLWRPQRDDLNIPILVVDCVTDTQVVISSDLQANPKAEAAVSQVVNQAACVFVSGRSSAIVSK